MTKIIIYTRAASTPSQMAKALLEALSIEYEEVDVTGDPALTRDLEGSSTRFSTPQMFMGGEPIGGWDELQLLAASGALDRLMALDPKDVSAIRRIVG